MFSYICRKKWGNKSKVYVIKENLCLDKLFEIKVVKLSLARLLFLFSFSFPHLIFHLRRLHCRHCCISPRYINLQLIRTWSEIPFFSASYLHLQHNHSQFPWWLPMKTIWFGNVSFGNVLKTWTARAFT